MAIISFWHIYTPVLHQMTGIGVRKQGKEKPSGYLQSKLDVTNLFVFPNPKGNLQGQGILLALKSYLYSPEYINQKLKSREPGMS